MGGKEVQMQRDKGAGRQVRQQELRGASHYDSPSLCVSQSLNYNLKARGQTKRCGRPWKTAVCQGTNTDRLLKGR